MTVGVYLLKDQYVADEINSFGSLPLVFSFIIFLCASVVINVFE